MLQFVGADDNPRTCRFSQMMERRLERVFLEAQVKVLSSNSKLTVQVLWRNKCVIIDLLCGWVPFTVLVFPFLKAPNTQTSGEAKETTQPGDQCGSCSLATAQLFYIRERDQDKENYFLLNEEEVQDPTHLLLTTLTFVSFQETEKKPHSHMRQFELHCPKILCPAHVGMVW